MLKEKISLFSGQVSALSKLLLARAEKFMPGIIVGSFVAGIFLAKFSPGFATFVNKAMSLFIAAYGVVAPLAIFIIVAPSLSRMFGMRKRSRFGGYIIGWLAMLRLLACIFGVIFTAIIFRFPLFPGQQINLGSACFCSAKSFLQTATHSSYFFAIYLGIIVSISSLKLPRVEHVLESGFRLFEDLGQYFEILIPIFMMAVGSYLYGLPKVVGPQLNSEQLVLNMGRVDFMGLKINPHTPSDFILIYLISSFLIGIACFIWHFSLLGWAKRRGIFSIKKYFRSYWVKAYPLLWATSSEALATPLNLYLTKKHFPQIKKEIRQLVVGLGSYLNINGTMICVFVLLGAVAYIIGFRLSLIELLFCIPVVFLLGYGVPGIPGELILFAGPIAILLNLPESIMPVFLALYCGLQLGLPDSFRTGNNSTDNLVCALLLNEKCKRKFPQQGGDKDGLENR